VQDFLVRMAIGAGAAKASGIRRSAKLNARSAATGTASLNGWHTHLLRLRLQRMFQGVRAKFLCIFFAENMSFIIKY
jgi:hypothetical protein